MRCRVAAALPDQSIVVDATAVDVIHENLIAIFARPIVTQINHRATMRVAAAGHILLRGSYPRPDGLGIGKVQMVGNGGNTFIGILAGGAIALGIVKRALNHMKEMWVNTVAHEGMPVIVPINTPRVGGADGIRLPHVPHRVVAPHTTLKTDALPLGRARLAKH